MPWSKLGGSRSNGAAGRPTACVSASPSQHPGGRYGLHMAEYQGALAQIIPDACIYQPPFICTLSEAPAEVGAGPHLDPGFADRFERASWGKTCASRTQKQHPVLTAMSDIYLFNPGCCSPAQRQSQAHRQGATLMNPVPKR